MHDVCEEDNLLLFFFLGNSKTEVVFYALNITISNHLVQELPKSMSYKINFSNITIHVYPCKVYLYSGFMILRIMRWVIQPIGIF